MNRNMGRQLSLRCETPTLKSRRSSLRRQLSEDEERAPPRVKLAWTTSEEEEDQKKKDEQHRKNEADASILYPDHQHLAERLRHVWQDKRTNLNIVLGAGETPKINDSLQPELMMVQQQQQQRRPHKDLKQIFQKQIRKNARTPPPPHPLERPIVVVPIIERPKTAVSTTAATRREQYQKRTSSAFGVSLKQEQIRPPLTRSSSLPTRNEPKTKFPVNKKRPKSTKRKDSISDTNKPPDVITMVSLLSPSGSDNEEETQKVDGSNVIKIKVPLASDQKVSSTHRKTVKSVSFQQTGVVHAVRSFSAGLPLRRGSLATTTLLLGNAAKKLINRNQQDNIAKRDYDDKQRQQQQQQEETQLIADPNENVIANRTLLGYGENDDFEKKVVVVEEDSPKEKECWDTYCKMNAKGVSVSFDTILRGMLTPTEYRLRRKQVAHSSQDF